MMVTTTFDFAGYRIREYKGLVRGIIVRSPTIKQGASRLRADPGRPIHAYAEMCEQTRQQAYEQLSNTRRRSVLIHRGLRYDARARRQKPATEVLCYGTAVVVEAQSRG